MTQPGLQPDYQQLLTPTVPEAPQVPVDSSQVVQVPVTGKVGAPIEQQISENRLAGSSSLDSPIPMSLGESTILQTRQALNDSFIGNAFDLAGRSIKEGYFYKPSATNPIMDKEWFKRAYGEDMMPMYKDGASVLEQEDRVQQYRDSQIREREAFDLSGTPASTVAGAGLVSGFISTAGDYALFGGLTRAVMAPSDMLEIAKAGASRAEQGAAMQRIIGRYVSMGETPPSQVLEAATKIGMLPEKLQPSAWQKVLGSAAQNTAFSLANNTVDPAMRQALDKPSVDGNDRLADVLTSPLWGAAFGTLGIPMKQDFTLLHDLSKRIDQHIVSSEISQSVMGRTANTAHLVIDPNISERLAYKDFAQDALTKEFNGTATSEDWKNIDVKSLLRNQEMDYRYSQGDENAKKIDMAGHLLTHEILESRAVDEGTWTPEQQTHAKLARDVFGIEPVFFDRNGADGQPVTSASTWGHVPGKIYIPSDLTGPSLMRAVGDEMWHSIGFRDPDLQGKLIQLMTKNLSKAQINEALSDTSKTQGAFFNYLPSGLKLNEVGGEVFSHAIKNAEFRDALLGKEPDLFSRVASFVMDAVDRIGAWAKGDPQAGSYRALAKQLGQELNQANKAGRYQTKALDERFKTIPEGFKTANEWRNALYRELYKEFRKKGDLNFGAQQAALIQDSMGGLVDYLPLSSKPNKVEGETIAQRALAYMKDAGIKIADGMTRAFNKIGEGTSKLMKTPEFEATDGPKLTPTLIKANTAALGREEARASQVHQQFLTSPLMKALEERDAAKRSELEKSLSDNDRAAVNLLRGRQAELDVEKNLYNKLISTPGTNVNFFSDSTISEALKSAGVGFPKKEAEAFDRWRYLATSGESVDSFYKQELARQYASITHQQLVEKRMEDLPGKEAKDWQANLHNDITRIRTKDNRNLGNSGVSVEGKVQGEIAKASNHIWTPIKEGGDYVKAVNEDEEFGRKFYQSLYDFSLPGKHSVSDTADSATQAAYQAQTARKIARTKISNFGGFMPDSAYGNAVSIVYNKNMVKDMPFGEFLQKIYPHIDWEASTAKEGVENTVERHQELARRVYDAAISDFNKTDHWDKEFLGTSNPGVMGKFRTLIPTREGVYDIVKNFCSDKPIEFAHNQAMRQIRASVVAENYGLNAVKSIEEQMQKRGIDFKDWKSGEIFCDLRTVMGADHPMDDMLYSLERGFRAASSIMVQTPLRALANWFGDAYNSKDLISYMGRVEGNEALNKWKTIFDHVKENPNSEFSHAVMAMIDPLETNLRSHEILANGQGEGLADALQRASRAQQGMMGSAYNSMSLQTNLMYNILRKLDGFANNPEGIDDWGRHFLKIYGITGEDLAKLKSARIDGGEKLGTIVSPFRVEDPTLSSKLNSVLWEVSRSGLLEPNAHEMNMGRLYTQRGTAAGTVAGIAGQFSSYAASTWLTLERRWHYGLGYSGYMDAAQKGGIRPFMPMMANLAPQIVSGYILANLRALQNGDSPFAPGDHWDKVLQNTSLPYAIPAIDSVLKGEGVPLAGMAGTALARGAGGILTGNLHTATRNFGSMAPWPLSPALKMISNTALRDASVKSLDLIPKQK